MFEQLDLKAAVSQGITTIVVGQDGGSDHPLQDFFARLTATPASVNVASYVGHGTLRRRVMGADFKRAAKPDEVAKMADLLRVDMKAGALGLSSGLEYDPGIYSDPSELIALAKAVAPFGGRYISHVRSEDRTFWKAIEEAINIGREARIPVQISHLKLAMRSLWGQTDRLIKMLDDARAVGRAGDGRYLSLHLLAGGHDRPLSVPRLRESRSGRVRAARSHVAGGSAHRALRRQSQLRGPDPRRHRDAARAGSRRRS